VHFLWKRVPEVFRAKVNRDTSTMQRHVIRDVNAVELRTRDAFGDHAEQ
jgi:hypothetical protein